MSTHVKQYEWRLNNTALKTLCVHIYVFVYTIPYIGQENRTKQKKKKRERENETHLYISFFIAVKTEHQTLILTYYYMISVSFSCHEAFRRYFIDSTVPLCCVVLHFFALLKHYISI